VVGMVTIGLELNSAKVAKRHCTFSNLIPLYPPPSHTQIAAVSGAQSRGGEGRGGRKLARRVRLASFC